MEIECDRCGSSLSELEFTVYRCPTRPCNDPSLPIFTGENMNEK